MTKVSIEPRIPTRMTPMALRTTSGAISPPAFGSTVNVNRITTTIRTNSPTARAAIPLTKLRLPSIMGAS
jgi:hypothetical protein